MEYVDNSLDSAEELRRASAAAAGTEAAPAEGYPKPIQVHIGIDRSRRRIWVSDNCTGIPPDTLTRLVSKIGESRKRGVAWLNGQFGFGLHAFRAAANALHVYSATDGGALHRISMDREQIEVTKPLAVDRTLLPVDDAAVGQALESGLLGGNAELLSGSARGDPMCSGTAVMLDKIDSVWFKSLTAASITSEIEHHFESLLRQPNLSVVVSQAGKDETGYACQPFDYDAIDGQHFQRSIELPSGHSVNCKLIVSKQVVEKKRPRFFKHGRCISNVSELKSFMSESKHGEELWGHPALCGYIEVGGALEPVITRDEFVKSEAREKLYTLMQPIERELQSALNEMMENHKDQSMAELEDVLQDSISKVIRADSGLLKALAEVEVEVEGSGESAEKNSKTVEPGDTDEDVTQITKDEVTYTTIKKKSAATRKPKNPDKRRVPISVRFVNAPDDKSTHSTRSFDSGNCLYINVAHPEFRSRQHKDSKGRLRFNSRIAAYLAAEVACHYKKSFYDRFGQTVPHERRQLYDELMDSVHSMEGVLSTKITTLEKKMRRQERWSPDRS